MECVINKDTQSIHIRQEGEIVLSPWEVIEMIEEEYLTRLAKFKDSQNVEKIRKLKSGMMFKGLKIDNYLENVKEFYNTQPFFYDKNQIFWYWDIENDRWNILDETDLMNFLDKNLDFYGQTVGRAVKGNYIEAFKRFGRLKQPKEAPLKWIQFKSKAYSLESQCVYTVTPDYFFTNPIPWELGKVDETPILDRLIDDWVGTEHKQELYEIMAYCLYRNYPIHRIFFLLGDGCNGKTTFLQVISKFLGINNLCSTELDNIVGQNSSRFETMKMYKKLACLMGETNFNSMSKTTMLKKLSGHDIIGFEMKGKQPFDDYSYAKLIIASNGLPITNDTTDGFWRRCLIVDFPNKFGEGKDILNEIPDVEYQNLGLKCINILRKLLTNGRFNNEGSIADREKKYTMASNPLPIFIKTRCKVESNLYHRYNELFLEYIQWLKKNKKRQISKKEFSKHLSEEGYEVRKTSKEGEIDYYVEGLKFFPDFPDFQKNPISSYVTEGNVGNTEIEEIEEKIQPSFPMEWDDKHIVLHKCTIDGCQDRECNFDSKGLPYCKKHWELMNL